MLPSSTIYDFLWRCAELESNQGVRAREKLIMLHDDEVSRTVKQQLDFTNLWIQLRHRLFDDYRRLRSKHLQGTTELIVYSWHADGGGETSSYRKFVVVQTSVLAQKWIFDTYVNDIRSSLEDRLTHIRLNHLHPMKEAFNTARFVLCCLAEGRKDTNNILDPPSQVAVSDMEWVRDRRYDAIQAFCLWYNGFVTYKKGGSIDIALGSWETALNLLKRGERDATPARMLIRHDMETRFDTVLRRTLVSWNLVLRANVHGAKSRIGWMLLLANNQMLGMTDIQIDRHPPADDSQAISDSESSDGDGEEDQEEESDRSEYDESIRRACAEAVDTAPPLPTVTARMKTVFALGKPDELDAARSELLVTTQNVDVQKDTALFVSSSSSSVTVHPSPSSSRQT